MKNDKKRPAIYDTLHTQGRDYILEVCNKQGKEPIDTLIEVYNSWLSRKIEGFNSSLYYENPGYLYESYLKGEVL